MSGSLVLALLLATASPDRNAARAELDAVAVRIEQLKARYAAGDSRVFPELHRLLVRAQELALTLDRIDPGGRPAGHPLLPNAAPTAEELRERADAARDEADRIRLALDETEARMAELQAGARAPQARFASGGAAPGSGSPDPALRFATLQAQRARLLRSLALVLAQAERLEAEARLLDSMK